MTKIQIAHKVPAATVAKIEVHLAEASLRDVNWEGVKFKLERDDFTCIPDNDRPEAIELLREINDIIDGHYE